MFRNKKDVDAHVRDVLAKCGTESERLKICFQIGKLYAGIKEFDSARRYVITYLNSKPANSADARKLLGDIQLELGDENKALEAYKQAYAEGQTRESLNRVCDLLSRGVGDESEESKKKWFEMQKATANNNPLNSTASSTAGSPAGSRRSIANFVGPPKSGFNHTFTNGSTSPLVSSANKLNANNVDLQLRYLERRFDDGLGKILEQNTLVLEQMLKMKEDMKELAEKVENIAINQEQIQIEVRDLKEKQSETQSLALENKQTFKEAFLEAKANKNCRSCETRPAIKEVVTQPCHSSEEIAGLKTHMEQWEKRTNKLIENLQSSLKFPDTTGLFPPYGYGVGGLPPNPALIPPQLPFANPASQIAPASNPVLPNVILPPPNSVAPAQPPTMIVGPAVMGPPPSVLIPPATPLPTVMVPKPVVASPLFPSNPAPAVITPVNHDPPQTSVVDWNTPKMDWATPKKTEEKKDLPFAGMNLSGKFSFGDLAKNNPSTPTFSFATTTNNQSFSSVGAPLFSSIKSPTSNKSTEEKTNNNTSHNAEEGEDDFVPTAEFQPVIPLPPLVEVKKGDEDENTIAEHRAKIYRFVSETKEWKERGVGNIKLLQSKADSRKCRVVMWREKVGKLACNFNLFPDIKVTNYQNNPKVLCWKCQDFAEEAAWETFTCRFGNEDDCAHFKSEMERLAKLTVAAGEKSPTPNKTNNDSSAVTPTSGTTKDVPLSQLFKKPEGSWNCGACYCCNGKDDISCAACQTVRPGYEDKAKEVKAAESVVQPSFSFGLPAANTGAPTFSFGFGSATASTPITTEQKTTPVTSSESVVDGKTPVKTDPESDSNVGGLNLAGKFSFADLVKNNNPAPSFSFGSTTSNQSFSGAGSQLFSSNTSTATTVNTSTNAEEGEDDFVPTAEFQPVIPLPPLVEVKKGDEDENTIAEHRAKIYRFVSETKEWKERGVGNIKLLQSKADSRKCRVVMWREKVGKLACNFNLFPDIKVTNYQNNPKVLCWKCQDFAEEAAWETFTCRFGNEADCAHFKTEMERLAKLTVAAGDKSPSPNETNNESSGVTPTSGTTNDVPLSQLFKKAEGSWNCAACYCSNGKDDMSCVACQTARPGYEDKVKEAKTTEVANTQPSFSFGLPAANTGAPTFSFGFGTATTANTSATKPIVNGDNSKASGEKKDNAFSGLNLSGKLSFGDLAKNNPSTPTFSFSTSTSNQSFSNAGAPLFSSIKSPASHILGDTSQNADEAEDDFVPTAEFQPVIPLPALVEVKKGDEDENTIAEYRAKIYRFVTETKEWKERGVGNIKLLQSKADSRKCRVVMWREKVGKLACNFNLFPDIKVTNYQNNPKVLCWKCQDFAEEPAWETFTCRFGKEDECAHFKKEMERLAKLTVAAGEKSPSKTNENSSAVAPTNGATKDVPLSQLFKKDEGSWNCTACYCSNGKDVMACAACQAVRPGFEDKTTVPQCACCSDDSKIREVKQLPASGLIDIPLDVSSCQEAPETVNFETFTTLKTPRSSTTPQSVAETEAGHASDAADSGDKNASSLNNSLANFSFSYETPEKSSPISFQFKAPSFSFKGNDSTSSIFGGASIFTPPAGGNPPGGTPSPFVSPLGQQSLLNNSMSPQSGFGAFSVAKPLFNVSSDQGGDEDGEIRHKEEDEYEDVEDEEEDECMFEDEAHVFIQDDADAGSDFDDKGEAVVRVLYDGENYCARLVVMKDGETIAEHLVAADTTLTPTGDLTYEWIGICNYESPIRSRLKVVFSEEEAYQSFATVMADSLEFAAQADITEAGLLEDNSGGY